MARLNIALSTVRSALAISMALLMSVVTTPIASAGGEKKQKTRVFCVAGCQTAVPQVVDTKPGIFDPGFIDHEPEVTNVREVAKYFWCEPGRGCTAYGEPHVPRSVSIHVYHHDRW
jgi:hypothetical protein